jgi:DNA-binding transcriptional ArsR family regulator
MEQILSFFVGFLPTFIGLAHLRMFINPHNCPNYAVEPFRDEGTTDVISLAGAGLLTSFAIAILLDSSVAYFIAGLCGGAISHPIYLAYIARREMIKSGKSVLQKKVVDLAAEYGGILSPLHLIRELEIDIKDAVELLESFVKYGLAVRIESDIGKFYDFPLVRSYMTDTEKRIIEILRDNPNGLTLPQLISKTNLSIESLNHTLDRLRASGIVISREPEGKFMLRGFTHRD